VKVTYKAFDKGGKPREGTIEAPSTDDATEQLRRDGLFVSEVRGVNEPASSEQNGPGARLGKRSRTRLKGGRLKTISGFMRQLSVLVTTGTPIVDAIDALEQQSRDPVWKGVLSDIRSRVEEGSPLSEALAAHPRLFDSVSRSLVRAGESGGKLDIMLTRLAELTRKQHKIRQNLVGSMIYPCLLIAVSIVVLCTMLLFVMPRFTGLFKTLDMPLPPTTKALMGMSQFLVNYWWAALIGIAGTITGLVFWSKSDGGRTTLHSLVLRLPHVSKVVRSFATARFARLMGLLLDSKVPMLECLDLTRQATANIHYAALLERAQESLTRGEPLSSAISAGGLIDLSVCQAVKNGERTGQLGPVLSSMADYLDEENEVLIKSLTGLIEPLILISLGVVVGLVATSMFLPLFDLTAMAGGGPPGAGGGAGGAP
jgi:type II secretory pathway component PulF